MNKYNIKLFLFLDTHSLLIEYNSRIQMKSSKNECNHIYDSFCLQIPSVINFSYIPLSMIKTMKVFRFLRGVLKSNKDISLCTRSLLRKQLPCICAETLLKFVFSIGPIVTTRLPIKDISITTLESP